MSEEQLKAFIEKVQSDTSLQEKLKAASNPDAAVSIAKEDLKNFRSELSDAELEGRVHGGTGSDGTQCTCYGPACIYGP